MSHGIISKVLGFRADAPDLTEVLMKLLEEAKQVARGTTCLFNSFRAYVSEVNSSTLN